MYIWGEQTSCMLFPGVNINENTTQDEQYVKITHLRDREWKPYKTSLSDHM